MGVFPNQYGCNYEVVMWFRNDGRFGEVKLNIGCKQRDVFTCNSTNIKYRRECGFHPTCKPVNIIRQLVKNCTDESDLVCDCFMGSGTTAVACKELKRNFIGCELNFYLEYDIERIK
jgi:site-specific DNA-methyltransferase (adenine-specific)